MPGYATNSFNQRPRGRLDPWSTRYYQQYDPFTANQAADNGGWTPPVAPQRHPEHEAIRNKAYADAIKFHDSNHKKVYTEPPVETVPSPSLIQTLTPKTPDPVQQPVQQPQAPSYTAPQSSQLPRFSDGTPYTPRGWNAEGSGMYFNSSPSDPLAQYTQGRAFSMQYNALGGGQAPAASPAAANIPLGPSGPIGGLTRMPGAEPLLGTTNVDPNAPGSYRGSTPMFDPFAYRAPVQMFDPYAYRTSGGF